MPHSSPTSPTSSATVEHCPTCRTPVVDSDVGEALSAVKGDLLHLVDIVEELIFALGGMPDLDLDDPS